MKRSESGEHVTGVSIRDECVVGELGQKSTQHKITTYCMAILWQYTDTKY